MFATAIELLNEHGTMLFNHLKAAVERSNKIALPLAMDYKQRQEFLFSRHDVSLYVHYPFCVHKCPYCDFASITSCNDDERDRKYTDMLIKEFKSKVHLLGGRKLISLYIGGGTPSLCEPKDFARLLEEVGPYLQDGAEISLEANPGTIDLKRLCDLRAAGFNRISIGVQSFDEAMLKRLGRIHNKQEAIDACKNAIMAGFDNYNLDLMHGLPRQDVAQSLDDLKIALELESTHLSWYELTIEEDTAFGKKPPILPDEDVLYAIEQEGFELLDKASFEHYEVSGYNLGGKWRCLHNQNYWLYGDYLGIGAAAHQKITVLKDDYAQGKSQSVFSSVSELSKIVTALNCNNLDTINPYEIRRSANSENYLEYFDACVKADMGPNLGTNEYTVVSDEEVPFEFMLNRLRMCIEPVSAEEYLLHTGQSLTTLRSQLESMAKKGLIKLESDLSFALTDEGKIMVNEAIAEFL